MKTQKRNAIGNNWESSLTREQEAEICRLYQEGYGLKAVCRRVLGRDGTSIITRCLDRNGVERRSGAEGKKTSMAYRNRYAKKKAATRHKREMEAAMRRDVAFIRKKGEPNRRARWRERRKEKVNQVFNKRYTEDEAFRLIHRYRCNLRKMKTHDLPVFRRKTLRCPSYSTFVLWMRNHLPDGMTLEECVFDHVIPVSWFDHSSDQEIELCWYYKNLRPVTTRHNIKLAASGNEAFRFMSHHKDDPVVLQLLKFYYYERA